MTSTTFSEKMKLKITGKVQLLKVAFHIPLIIYHAEKLI
jgi:hypothetical protein